MTGILQRWASLWAVAVLVPLGCAQQTAVEFPAESPQTRAADATAEQVEGLRGRVTRDHGALGTPIIAADFQGGTLDDAAFGQLVADGGLRQVERLSLARTRITDVALADCSRLERLKVLFLTGAGVTGAGLTSFRSHTALETLDLSDTRVGDAAVEPLAEIKPLKQVILVNTPMSQGAIERLKALRPDLQVAR